VNARIAIVDPGSFVLPYDYQLAKALAAQGVGVDFLGSATDYNGEFLEAMGRLPGVRVDCPAISRTVAPRWKGVLAYAGLLLRLWRRAADFATVNLQFSVLWPLELPVFFALRRRFVFTVHNAVPHGFAGRRHRPTLWLASLARALVFVSDSTRQDFIGRYGERFRAKSSLVPHGLLPVAPTLGAVDYAAAGAPRALVFWSTVKAYKGVELFAELARCDEIRRRGLALKVCGAWSPELRGLRDELRHAGVEVQDRYLDEGQLLALLAEDALFVLPYREASQSGALYSLLNHGRMFICADVGDLGAFMRRFGLDGLLLKERSAAGVLACVAYLEANREALVQAFARAQQASRWDRLMADAGPAYGSRPGA
jgi:hypothetical protein